MQADSATVTGKVTNGDLTKHVFLRANAEVKMSDAIDELLKLIMRNRWNADWLYSVLHRLFACGYVPPERATWLLREAHNETIYRQDVPALQGADDAQME